MKSKTKVTIYDVAKACNVSYATVSRSINSQSDVNEKTRQKVLEMCKKMNYTPNAFARGLSQKKSWLVGIVSEGSFGHPFFGEILSSTRKVLETQNYDLIFIKDEGYQSPEEFKTKIENRNLDAIVVVGVAQNSNMIKTLNDIDIPIVTVNFRLKNHSAIISQQYRGAIKALDELWNLGHRDIIFIAGSMRSTSGRYRYKAFLDFMKNKGIEVKDRNIIKSNFTEESRKNCYEEVQKLIKRKELPTAFFCSYDYMALGVIEALTENDINVPNDISVIGYDDYDYCTYIRPKLSTIKQDKTLMGDLVGKEILRLLRDKKAKPKTIDVPTQLIIRESTSTVKK